MNPLSFYLLFLVVYLWQYVDLKQDFQLSQQATFKNCLQKYCSDQPVYIRTVTKYVDLKQDFQLSQQATFKNCLQKYCSDQPVSIRTVTKISSWQSCHKECLLKIRKQSFVGTRHINPIFKRIRRERHEECKNASNNATVLSTKDINVTISKPGNTEGLLVNVSWNPPPDMIANWTGYKMIYAITDDSRDWQFGCQDLGKNATFSIINFPSNVLREFKEPVFSVKITSLPYLRSKPVGGQWKSRKLYLEPTPTQVTQVEPDATTVTQVEPDATTVTQVEPDATTVEPDATTVTQVEPDATTGNGKDYTDVVLPISIVLVVLVLTGMTVLVLKYALRTREPPISPPDPSEFEYDAFIMYSTADQEFVIQCLLPVLEGKHGFRCCIHYRDFLVGVPFIKNMEDGIYKSRKTIALVSRNFFESQYCCSELEMARHRLLENGDESVVIIKFDDVEREKLPRVLRERSYIDYTKSTDRETWESKLVRFLRAGRHEQGKLKYKRKPKQTHV